ncbi:MAG: cytochrome b [Reyranellaceae bacterium]
MNRDTGTAGYGAIARALHWASALCVVAAWLLGVLGDDLPRAMRPGGLFVHMSLGLAVLALALGRIGWRFVKPPPAPLPTTLGAWTEDVATAAHWALYAFLIAVPIAGIMLQFARGGAVPVFGLFEIASPWPRDRAFARSVKEVHELMAHVTLLVAALHAGAALFHHYVLKDATLRRMLPGRH